LNDLQEQIEFVRALALEVESETGSQATSISTDCDAGKAVGDDPLVASRIRKVAQV
jgi:hypothetical protein